MWRLHMTNAVKEWIEVGPFDSVTAAARRIRELEGSSAVILFMEIDVDTLYGNDEEAFGFIKYTGRRALYVLKRCVN